MAPRYDVQPGKAIAIFQLGDTLWHVLDLLRTHKTDYPKVGLSWDPESPHKSAVTIHLAQLTLYFPHSLRQSLQLIVVPSLATSRLVLHYEAQVLSSPTQRLTRARVGRTLGPTYASTGSSTLSYPGITFDLLTSSGEREDLVETLTVSPKSEEAVSLGPISSVAVHPNRGVTIYLPDAFEVIIGETTAQDLLLDLGPPLRKFWKEDDRVERMWGGAESTDDEKGACFWNYFQYGMDFLILRSGVVSKIILYSNIPGTPLFQRYSRAPWTIPVSSGTLDFTCPLASFRINLTSKSQTRYTDEVRLTVPTTGKKKTRASSPAEPRATVGEEEPLDTMMLDRVGEGGLDGVIGVGGSRLLGFDGLIVEEDRQSSGICSVLVYKERLIA
ncbi:MAG: hypothetical protein TREMPRED_000250 [Tremellales sp. Tagirdzhanova-0007]|nr:MAG: hypothetical protein TREMPRED_000250 [Tremellales sp. Tagirdzhanova-0007]